MCIRQQSDAALGDQRGHLRVAAQRGHVVDHRRAGVERRGGHRGLGGVDRDLRGAVRPSPAPRSPAARAGAPPRRATGSAPGGSTRRRCRGSSAPSRSSCEPVGDRRRRVEVAAAVGERVGRDVDHAHDVEARRACGSVAASSSGQRPCSSKYSRARSSASRSRLLSTLIRNIQLIIHTISADPEQHHARARPAAVRRVPEHDRHHPDHGDGSAAARPGSASAAPGGAAALARVTGG